MPEMRKRTVRRITVPPKQILRRIRALYMITYNDPRPLQPLSVELFHTLGDILEGVPPEELDLHLIDRTALIDELDYDADDIEP